MAKIFHDIIKVVFYVSVLPLISLMVLTFLDVGARYAFNSSVNSTLEINELLLSILISLAVAYTTYQRDNFSVTFLTDRMTGRKKSVFDAISSFIAAVVCYVLSFQATLQAFYSLESGEYTGALEVPVYPAKFLFAFGCFLTAVVLTIQFGKTFRRKYKES